MKCVAAGFKCHSLVVCSHLTNKACVHLAVNIETKTFLTLTFNVLPPVVLERSFMLRKCHIKKNLKKFEA